jgi:hypothetical protein
MSEQLVDPPKVWEWLRWDRPDDPTDDLNKWHLIREESPIMETVCGQAFPLHDDPEIAPSPFLSEFVPEDEHGVCMHCLRYREQYNREQEQR